MANRYNTIVVSSPRKGRSETVVLSGTPKPGTCLSGVAATEPISGRFTYAAWNKSASGVRGEVCVLEEDLYQGKTVLTAGVSGDLRQVYFPYPGDLLQMLVKNVTGTGDTFAIDDELMIEDGTGLLIAATGEESVPFVIRETVSVALAADTLVLCMYTGH